MPEGARPVFAGGKDRQRFAFLYVAHFSLGMCCRCLMMASNFDLSVRYDRGTRVIIIGRRLYLRLPLLRGGSRVAGGEDEKINDQMS